VAVVDSGIDDSHTDFNGKIFNWTDCAKFLSDCTTVGVQLHDNLGHGTSAASIIVGTGQQAGIASSPGFVNLTAYGEFNGSDGSKDYRHWFPYSSISTDLSFNASLNWTGPAGQWQILNISNNSLPDIGSNASNIEPLKVTSLTIPSGSEDYAFVRIKANSTDGVESNDNVYIVSFTTRLRNLSDSFNLLTGTATGTQVISVKVVEDDDQTNSWDWLEGINWIGNHTTSDNIRIASMSLGGAWSPTEAQIFESLIKKGS
jgi:subtilisin family serine protease